SGSSRQMLRPMTYACDTIVIHIPSLAAQVPKSASRSPMKITDFDLFQETMNSIGAYLLVAPERHSKYLLGKPVDDPAYERRSTPALRVTQHYVSALLAYGFPVDSRELRWAAEWFATPFPNEN